jgi:PLP dependent protein
MAIIASNLQHLRRRIDAAAGARKVELLAVSKGHPAQAIREAFAAGQRLFGESYVQEALEKARQLRDLAIEWHFIGPIQSNKTKPIAEHFAWVHSVERAKIAARLAASRPRELLPLNICLQVNVSAEHGKAGVAPAELLELASQVAPLAGLRLRGLMTIPELTTRVELQRQRFAQLRALSEMLSAHDLQLDTLSMGMSADWEVAIEEGATVVRLGTAIFGERKK